MVYMGSKNRIAKDIIPIINRNTNINDCYIEPFVGGCNIIDKVKYSNRIANDKHKYLIAMFKALVYDNFIPKDYYSKELYYDVRENKDKYPDYLVGYIGFNCSRLCKWFGGYINTLNNRNYQLEQKNNIMNQLNDLKGVQFINKSYDELEIPNNSIVYCDPPYKHTEMYSSVRQFDYNKFYEWCVKLINDKNCKVYISEYNIDDDRFKCIYQKSLTSTISHTTTLNISERLYVVKEADYYKTLMMDLL